MIEKTQQISGEPVSGKLAFRLLEEAAIALDDSPTNVLQDVGIPFTLDDLAGKTDCFVPRPYFVVLAGYCISAFERKASSDVQSRPFSKDDYKMLCYCLINCPTVESIIIRAGHFCAALGRRAGVLELETDKNIARFSMTTFRADKSNSAMMSDLVGLTSYHRLFSWLCGEYIELNRMASAHSKIPDSDELCDLFKYPIEFYQESNFFEFSVDYLQRKNIRSYSELEELLEFFPFDFFSDDWRSMNLATAVENVLRSHLLRHKSFPSSDMLVDQFKTSGATLRRHLAQEGKSISSIKKHCRMDLARELLALPQLSIDEISIQLGYSDPRIFRRAFRDWNGMSPSEYRTHN